MHAVRVNGCSVASGMADCERRGASGGGAASPDGRYIAYSSTAANLANGWTAAPDGSDTNPGDIDNIYRYDRVTGETVLVSVDETGNGVANADCSAFWMSADGNKIIFSSQATNLHPMDTDDTWDTFERDIAAGTTTLLNINNEGTAKIAATITSVSEDGNLIVLETNAQLSPLDTNSFGDVYVRNLSLGTTTLVSINTDGVAANQSSGRSVISANGRVVLFNSRASNLDLHDTNSADQRGDLFARDLVAGTTQLVSIKATGTGIDEYLQTYHISADGRFVVFDTAAKGIVASDLNNADDVFVRDLTAGTTQWVNQGHIWGETPLISASGNVVVYLADGFFAYNLTTHGTTMLLSSNDVSGYSVSADGSQVAFTTRFLTGELGFKTDVYVYSFGTGAIRLVSKNDQGIIGNGRSVGGISPDGSTVVFVSESSNIVPGDSNGVPGEFGLPGVHNGYDVFAYDVASDHVELISKVGPGLDSRTASLDSAVGSSAVSADGRYVAFTSRAPNLVNGITVAPGVENVYRYDRVTGHVALVSINKTGDGSGNGNSNYASISADGNVVAFLSTATNLSDLDTDTLSDIYARDFTINATELVTVNFAGTGPVNAENQTVSLSADGHRIAFQSRFTGLDPVDNNSVDDVFVRDLATHTTYFGSINAAGTGSGDGPSTAPSLSSDGTKVAFSSSATNLSSVATTGDQVFVRDLTTGVTQIVSANIGGTGGGNGVSSEAVISGNGNVVAFISAANNLVSLTAGNNNMYPNVFARDLTTGFTYLASVNSAGNGAIGDYCYDPQISADGRIVVYSTHANVDPHDSDDWEMDVYARNTVTSITYFVSDDTSAAGSNDNDGCYNPVLSSDGNIVAFATDVNNEQVLIHNIMADTTQLVSTSTNGGYGANDGSYIGSINAGGNIVAFTSDASDLVAGDYNGREDAFVAAISWNTPSLIGDYNGDGAVDTADYVVWRKTMGTIVAPHTGADGSGNGVAGPEDFDVWRAHFGEILETSPAANGTPALSALAGPIAPVEGGGDSAGDAANVDAAVNTPAGMPAGKIFAISNLGLAVPPFVDFGQHQVIGPRLDADVLIQTDGRAPEPDHDAALMAWLSDSAGRIPTRAETVHHGPGRPRGLVAATGDIGGSVWRGVADAPARWESLSHIAMD